MKKLLAILVCMVFVVSILPMSVFGRPSLVDSDAVKVDDGGDNTVNNHQKIWGYSSKGENGGIWYQLQINVVNGSTADKAVAKLKSAVRSDITAAVGATVYYVDDYTGNESIYSSVVVHTIPDGGADVTTAAPNIYAYAGRGSAFVDSNIYGTWTGTVYTEV